MSPLLLFRTADELHSKSFLSTGGHTPNNLLGGRSESSKCHLFCRDLLRLIVAAQPPLDTGGMDYSMMIINTIDPTQL